MKQNKTIGRWAGILVCLLGSLFGVFAQTVTTYPTEPGAVLSSNFTVFVNGTTSALYFGFAILTQ